MKCLVCEKLSFSHICKACQKELLKPQISKRKLSNNIEVISFYKYQDIEDLLLTKHKDLGYYIYNILAKNSFYKFAKNFEFTCNVASLSIDDSIKSGYSHSAILNRHLKSKYIKPFYNRVIAQSDYKYSAKSYEQRLANPRDFKVSYFKEDSVILVDDIITTGLTLTQACEALHVEDKEVLFCLTLADAKL
jgi:competence protein ComFC